MQDSMKWCAGLKDGLRMTEPDEEISKSYLNEAKASLLRAEKNFAEGDLLWTTVVAYYAEYYALYSFLQKIGVKCGNHFCSILTVERLLGRESTKTIVRHKNKRIDAQYYMKIGKEDDVKVMLREAKAFVIGFDALVSNLTSKEIHEYGRRFKLLLR